MCFILTLDRKLRYSLANPSHVYFISDIHLGVDSEWTSLQREEYLISWLNHISKDAQTIYIVGDLFDYWFEYKNVVPKGYFNLLSILNTISKQGICLIYLTGNHDMWHKDYVSSYTGVQVVHGILVERIGDKQFYIAHGDGLGPGDLKYKFIKGILKNSFCQSLFGALHPTIGLRLMKYMSRKSRESHDDSPDSTQRQKTYCKEVLAERSDIDFFIMGHQHQPEVTSIDHATYINLGDWTKHFTYAVWDGKTIDLKKWDVESATPS